MNTPNLELMRHFHTEDVYEQKLAGGIPLAARFMLASANVARGQADDAEQQTLQLQAQEMNERLREARALKMQATNSGFQHTRAPMVLSAGHTHGMMSGEDVPVGMDEGMVRMASVAGRMFAHVDLDAADFNLEKQAIPSMGEMAKSVGSAFKGVGTTARNLVAKTPKLTPKLPTASSSVAGRVEKQMAAQKARLAPPAPKAKPLNTQQKFDQRVALQDSAQKVRQAKTPQERFDANVAHQDLQQQHRQQRANNGTPPPPAKTTQQAGPYRTPDAPSEPTGGQAQGPKPPPTPQQQTPQQGVQPPQPQQGVQPPAQPQQAVQNPQPQQQQTPQATGQNPTATTGNAAAPAGDGLGDKAKAMWDRTGLSNDRWKWKVPALAAAGLGAYGVYRAGKAAIGALGQEQSPDAYNAGAAQPASYINEYGQPQR